jgi:hypothetical protein
MKKLLILIAGFLLVGYSQPHEPLYTVFYETENVTIKHSREVNRMVSNLDAINEKRFEGMSISEIDKRVKINAYFEYLKDNR